MKLKQVSLLFLALYGLLTIYLVAAVAFSLPRSLLLTPIATLLAFAFALCHAGQRLGWRRAILLLALTFGVALLFESVGVATGRVYGPYHYTDILGPKFLGLVPYLIPAAWFMMSYPSLVIADDLAPRKAGPGWLRGVLVAALGAVVMTSWDLAMDPLMVQSGHWVWEVNGAYYGIPIQNYLGWLATVFTTFGLFLLLEHGVTRAAAQKTTGRAYDRQAILSYAITAVGNTITALLMGLVGSTLIGLFWMGVWIVLAIWRTRRRGFSALDAA